MAGKLYKTGESFSLDSDSSKQSLSLRSLGKTDEFTNIRISSLTASWGRQLSAWKCLVLRGSFHLRMRLIAFAPEQGAVLQGTERANSLQSGKEASIWHFVEPQTPGKARPEDQNLTDKVSDGIEGSRLSQNLTLAQRSQMPVEHRANFEHTEFVTPLLWALNNFKEVDFFLPFFFKDLQSLIQQKRHIILDNVCLPPGLV